MNDSVEDMYNGADFLERCGPITVPDVFKDRELCITCKFWDDYPSHRLAHGWRGCRKHAPTHSTTNSVCGTVSAQWANTNGYDRCGDWESLPEIKADNGASIENHAENEGED